MTLHEAFSCIISFRSDFSEVILSRFSVEALYISNFLFIVFRTLTVMVSAFKSIGISSIVSSKIKESQLSLNDFTYCSFSLRVYVLLLQLDVEMLTYRTNMHIHDSLKAFLCIKELHVFIIRHE